MHSRRDFGSPRDEVNPATLYTQSSPATARLAVRRMRIYRVLQMHRHRLLDTFPPMFIQIVPRIILSSMRYKNLNKSGNT